MTPGIMSAAYLVAGLLVFYRTLRFLDARNKDGDPEGLDFLTALCAALFWPVVVPLFFIYRLIRG